MANVQQTKHLMRNWMVKHGLTVARMNVDSPVWGLGARRNAWRMTGHVGKASTQKADVDAILFPKTVQENALAWELREVGTKEQPAYSNDGTRVRYYQSATGAYKQPWCASFQTRALVDCGLPKSALPPIPAYVPSWTEHIRNHRNGWRPISFSLARPGDIVTLWDSGHIEMVREKPHGDALLCVGGNTSPVGQSSNGGMVACTTRYRHEVTVIGRHN